MLVVAVIGLLLELVLRELLLLELVSIIVELLITLSLELSWPHVVLTLLWIWREVVHLVPLALALEAHLVLSWVERLRKVVHLHLLIHLLVWVLIGPLWTFLHAVVVLMISVLRLLRVNAVTKVLIILLLVLPCVLLIRHRPAVWATTLVEATLEPPAVLLLLVVPLVASEVVVVLLILLVGVALLLVWVLLNVAFVVKVLVLVLWGIKLRDAEVDGHAVVPHALVLSVGQAFDVLTLFLDALGVPDVAGDIVRKLPSIRLLVFFPWELQVLGLISLQHLSL